MADYTIQISATTATPYPPTLSDGTNTSSTESGDQNFTTEVEGGKTIQWEIDGDISSIESITFEKDNFFTELPTADNDWTATLKPKGKKKKGATDQYTIDYNVTGAPNNPYSQDPRLKMT